MTIDALSRLYWLDREIRLLGEQREELLSKAEKCTSKLGGSGKGGGYGDNSAVLAKLADLSVRLRSMEEQCLDERGTLEDYIEKIPDPQIRLIFRLKFVEMKTWQQIAFYMGEFDESYPRRRFKRFFEGL